MRGREPLPDDYDQVGPFHPYIVWALVIVVDLLIVFALLAVFAMVCDSIEDAIWPGGFDWIPRL